MEVKTRQIRNLQTAWIQYQSEQTPSQAPIVLLLHGFPDVADVWKQQIEYFAKNYLVIAPYNRGVGGSEQPAQQSRYRPESILLDHLEILRMVDLNQKRKVLIIGHDIGTLYAWNLCRHLQERCLGLVIINGGSLEQMALRFKKPRQVIKSWYVWMLQLPKAPLLWKVLEPKLIRRAYRQGGFETNDIPSGLEHTTRHYREAVKYVAAFLADPDKTIRKVQTPVLILCSQEDPFLEPPTIGELEALSSDYTIRFVKGGHWVHCQRPERVHSLIDRFVESIAC